MGISNVQMLLHIALLLCAYNLACVASKAPLSKPGCPSHCGNLTEIPYPFGIGEGCYFDEHFRIICNHSTTPPKAFLNLNNTSVIEVLEISLQGTIKVTSPITFSNCTNKTSGQQPPNLNGSPFMFSQENRFTAVSCGELAFMTSLNGGSIIGGCLSICDQYSSTASCGGSNCCQATIPQFLSAFNTSFVEILNADSQTACKYAFLVDQHWFASTNISIIRGSDHVPILLEWSGWNLDFLGVGLQNWRNDNTSTYCMNSNNLGGDPDRCVCSEGFEGNPYFHPGCLDINECEDPNRPPICGVAGICVNDPPGRFMCRDPDSPLRPAIIGLGAGLGLLFLLIIGARWVRKTIKKTRKNDICFKRNGGLLLEKQLSSGEVNVEKIRLFKSKELEKCTDNFNTDRILGHGGQGTVYKGMLSEGRIVAVKRSKMVDESQVSDFINEVVILSQINHRNVVQLFGCCLETEVPILVYEFIPNGSLAQFIHENQQFPLTWKTRLRIAIEVAGALSYLHCASSFPIFHRDIKSANILLDGNYRAKVADFGTSRSVAIDQTHLTTLVHGTFGYLDPEYYRLSKFTDKSDVYSFGVVLVELLTGQKPISFIQSQEEGRSLAAYFLLSMNLGRLFEILDAQVINKGSREDIITVANVARRCLSLSGRNRPTMREVAAELEGVQIRGRALNSDGEQRSEEVEYVRTESSEPCYDLVSSSVVSEPVLDRARLPEFPLLPFKSR